jgi:opacity protein-like surface antigen
MIALAVAFSLTAAAGFDDTDLPRSLSLGESRFEVPGLAVEPVVPPRAELSWWAGPHLGVAAAYDASGPAFLLGGSGRVHILPWLGAEVSIDFQTKQAFEQSQIHIFQVPFEFAALFYPRVEGPVRPYGTAGIGFTITDVTYSKSLAGLKDQTDLNALFFLGFGAEFELQPNILVDANLRFIFATDPPHFSGNSTDWIQFTIGVLVKLSQ